MSYRFFLSHSEFVLALLDVQFAGIKSSFALIKLTLEISEARGPFVYLTQHIHEAMEKCADFSKTTAIGCRFCRHMLNWNCVLSLDKDATLPSKEIGLVDLREFLADQSRDIWVEFLRPATLEVEDALIVYAQRFGELRGGHTDGLKHVFDDAASHRNELVLSYVILHICNKIIFAMASNHSHNQHL